MTPGARVSAAIEVLDAIAGGLAAEQALTRWARQSRFAGSKDRAAVRDHVFDVLRQKRTAAHYGGSEAGRALMIGMLHGQKADLDALFTGEGHAPMPLSEEERRFPQTPEDRATNLNLPDWLLPLFDTALGEKADAAALALQERGPICLRVNTARIEVAAAQELLAEDGVQTRANPLTAAALTVTEGPRRIRNSRAFIDGYVELQDAASQAVVAGLPLGGRVLDYCAGGGGKALALAMDPSRQITAHDIDPRRMSDLPLRAERAGVEISIADREQVVADGPYDLVLCDAPCSGSGAWRRAAEGKWTLTPDRLTELTGIQDQILDAAATLTTAQGVLAYATCSLFREENEARVDAFLTRHPEWKATRMDRFDITSEGDGFFVAQLTRD
ncbi:MULTISPECIES: RsmB/NOP family class I SAM-dependent RNA methyltransferase [Sulfitobacter]|uniref:Ribosomal RNA small subunit methyltransferase B n=1 Tax=Sulfitobacter dubius TaxID=218673 RepID=A0ABY3ZJH6_9RHOB|nr:RsmB/NOP family class I SAM-dependent RNA methyltransferase [Sulfitobacter dubius]UOA14731.1 Ribosomal RNA small subunit methyltransferase B [Sulfitobacter dubius]WOI29815.1 RsmB/NOP family class I SAM-dependent RNA methyltransferase [Sulfitobacter dubius]